MSHGFAFRKAREVYLARAFTTRLSGPVHFWKEQVRRSFPTITMQLLCISVQVLVDAHL